MKAAPFAYARPAGLDEAIGLVGRPDAKALAGGQSLVPMMAMRLVRPALLVDLNGLPELAALGHDADWLHVGAMVRQRTLERMPGLAGMVPLLAAALPCIGHREIRNRGTVGGSIVHADPSAELLLVAATLQARITLRGPAGERRLAADEFAVGPFHTAVEPGELATQVSFPVAKAGDGHAFEEVARRHGDYALCGVAVTLRREAGAVASARVGLLGVGPVPAVHDVGELVAGEADGNAWERAGVAVAERIDPSDDMHASAAYRRRLARVLVARGLERAWEASA
jgi:CO/xanthine dehydrogenase FAD-binding subunit